MSWIDRSKTFIAEVKAEMKKVTFPSRDEVISTSIVVLIASFVFGVYLAGADWVIRLAYRSVVRMFGS